MSRQEMIRDLNLPVRTERLLTGAGFVTIGQLLEAPASQVLDVLQPIEYDELVGRMRTFGYLPRDACIYREVSRRERKILFETQFGNLTISWLATYR